MSSYKHYFEPTHRRRLTIYDSIRSKIGDRLLSKSKTVCIPRVGGGGDI